MFKNKSLITVFIILVAVAAAFSVKMLTQGRLTSASTEKSRTKGNPNAAIKIVEYIDFQCPMCAMGARKLKEYTDKYQDKIFLEMHYFPLEMHKHALEASQYAQCSAQQGKFWAMHDLLVEKQKTWAETNNAAVLFDIYAKEIGVNMGKLKACLSSESVNRAIEKNKKEGRDAGVRSTPTYFINGKMVVGIKFLQEELDSLLGVAKSPDQSLQP